MKVEGGEESDERASRRSRVNSRGKLLPKKVTRPAPAVDVVDE
jgi:hypothetical protein